MSDTRGGKQRNVKEMSKHELEETLKKKKECSAIAMRTVERMLENPVDVNWFMDNLKYIRQSHFNDVVEERAIMKQCGYPLCCKTLGNVTQKRYHISVKTNKIYDTTERKKFCSNQCYKAATYLQEQLLTSPLWFHEEIPHYKLIPVGFASVAGEEICPKASDPHFNEIKEEFTSTSEFGVDSLAEMPSAFARKSSQIANDKIDKKISALTVGSFQEGKELDVNHSQEQMGVLDKVTHPIEIVEGGANGASRKLVKEHPVTINQQEHVEHKQVGTTITVSHTNPKPSQLPSKLPSKVPAFPAIVIANNLHEWCNLETLIFLFGETQVKDMIVRVGRSVKEYNQAFCNASWDPKLQDRYDKICKRLNLMELDDMQYDERLHPGEKQMKPLPSYRDIQEDGKKMELKVNAFFEGKLTYVEDTGDLAKKETDDNAAPVNLMPLVDISSQRTLRKKIVLDKLKPGLTELLRTTDLGPSHVMSEVRALVNTFSLEAHNITYKPLEWSCVAIIIVEMLALKNPVIQKEITSPSVKKYQTSVLHSLCLSGDYIKCLVNKLTDLKNLTKTDKNRSECK